LKRRIHLSGLAEADLIAIWQFSSERWDADQADRYFDELDRGIALLTDNAELGTKRDDEREGYRALLVNRHAIYYTATRSTIHVVRVLHVQMDLDEGL
jgi:toxin ParE1/3/4